MQMKTLFFVLALGACSLENIERPNAVGSNQKGAVEISGFLASRGEFRIFSNRQAYLANDPSKCISGIFSDYQKHVALTKQYHGKKVRLRGRFENWASLHRQSIAMDPLTEGTPVLQNGCGGDRVFIADDATLAK